MEKYAQANSAIQGVLHIMMRWHLEQWALETRKSWWLV